MMKNCASLLFLLAVTCACTSPEIARPISPAEREWLLSGEALGDGVPQGLRLPEERVLYLSGDMREFAERAVAGYEGRDRVVALLEALVVPSGLGLEYDSQAVFTAEEVFRHRRANCLSFTNLFIAMGRYVDMDVQYNEVDVPPIWDLRQHNTLVLNKHINAMVTRQRAIRHVIDLNSQEYETYYEQRNISDSLAIAQHYNNKAMGYLVEKDFANTLRYMARAIDMEPEVSYLWNNLGSLYRRAGNLRAAELAYLAALSEDPRDLVAMSNVARLYEHLGRRELAARYKQMAQAHRMQNPYYLYTLAQKAVLEGDYRIARERVTDAIERNEKEHRFYFLLGVIYQRSGEPQLAGSNFKKALELASDREQQARYRNKMERVVDASS